MSGTRRTGSGRLVATTTTGSGRLVEKVITNKNVSWLDNPGVWVAYIGLVVASWLAFTGIFGSAGLAWTYVHLLHGAISYYMLHWVKGSADAHALDGGKYAGLTIWEQLDEGTYGTLDRKLLAMVPVVTYLLATNGAPFTKQPLGLNLAVVVLLVFAKLPYFHKVRIFGIGK